MKFFIDTANLDEIRLAAATGVIDGVTTNPSIIAREGRPFADQIRLICDVIDGDVSAEVISTTLGDMIRDGRELAAIHRNVVVKCPLTRDGVAACARLSRDGIRVNVTLCFSPAQALLAAKAGAYYVSPFVGRVDDIGQSGERLIADISEIYRLHGLPTQILAASLRGPAHVVQAAKAGANVCTLSLKVLESLYAHPLTDAGLAQFLADYERAFAGGPTCSPGKPR